jgi:hypothetical protein
MVPSSYTAEVPGCNILRRAVTELHFEDSGLVRLNSLLYNNLVRYNLTETSLPPSSYDMNTYNWKTKLFSLGLQAKVLLVFTVSIKRL